MRSSRWWQAVLVLVVIAAGLWFWRDHSRAEARERQRSTASGAGRAGGEGGDRPSPVLIATATRRDVPIYLEGLGTVSAFYTVTVRPQVAGRVERVLFVEGQAVHRGDLLAEIDRRPFLIALHQAQATLARDRAQLTANERTLARAEQLRTNNYVSPQDYDNARAAVEQYRAIVQADRAQIENAELQLDYARPRAPIDGVTGARLVDPGNLVAANDPTGIVTITQIDPIAVYFTLPQDDLAHVQERMTHGLLPVQIYARDGTTRLAQGTLSLVDNQVNANTATIRLKAIAPNAERQLWPQQFVKVRLLLETRFGALVIPAAAIQRGPQGSFVYLVGNDQRVSMRPVQLERIEGETVLVRNGLGPGDRVITDGQARLRPGSRVVPREASAEGDGGSRRAPPASSRGNPTGGLSDRSHDAGAPSAGDASP